MKTVPESNISVIDVTKMITYAFVRGALLRMHDRSVNNVFLLAISAIFDFFTLVCAKVTGW